MELLKQNDAATLAIVCRGDAIVSDIGIAASGAAADSVSEVVAVNGNRNEAAVVVIAVGRWWWWLSSLESIASHVKTMTAITLPSSSGVEWREDSALSRIYLLLLPFFSSSFVSSSAS